MIQSANRWVAGLLLVAAVLCAVATVSCLSGDRLRGEPISVAFAGPTSGISAEDGLSAVRAIELVFDRVNAAGGIGGRPLVLAVFDDGNDPDRARAVASEIADESNALAVIGHNTSTCSIAAGEIYAARGVPAVATAATNVAVTKGDWYFRVIFDDRAQGRFVVAYVREALGAQRFGLVHETAAYGSFLAEVMQEAARQLDVSLTAQWRFDPAAAGLEARLDAIAAEAVAAAPPVLVLAMQPEAGAPLVKRLRDRGYAGEIVATDALASRVFTDAFRDLPDERRRSGFYTDGIYASTPFLFDSGGRLADAFRNEYIARHEAPPDWYAAFAADAAGVLVEALRRSGLSPTADTLAADRAALRDALSAIGPHEPVEGITGATWFDAEGNAEKPIPLGRFLNRDLLSAFVQLRPVPGAQRIEDIDLRLDPARIVRMGDALLYRSDVARVGVRAGRFANLDFVNGSFEIEFDVWFRHGGDRDLERIAFTNAVEPIVLGEPLDEVAADGLHYRLYRTEGVFQADALEAPYGGHVLSLSFHHVERTRDDLALVVDTAGMNLGRNSTRAQRGATARRLLGATTEWAVDDIFFFEDQVDEPALGHPAYLAAGTATRSFSQLTIGVGLRSQSVRGLLPAAWRGELLVVSALGTLVLLFAGRGSRSALRFVLQGSFALLLLLVAEPVVGSWWSATATPRQIAQLVRLFDVLWWVLPALLVIVAIERFVWQRAEARSGAQVPSLLRWFVVSIVLIVAFFGVVAFVYDYRLTGLLATSGVLAMVIGLAVQLNITNMFAGVAINLERPFRVGDWIMIHGRTPDPEASVIGQVVDINWRTTRLQTADDTVIVIPNGIISEKTITNFNQPGEMSRFALSFTVDQAVPTETVIPVILRAVEDVIGAEKGGPLADPPPKVRINEATPNGIEYIVRYRIRPREVSPLEARHTVNESVLRHLRAAGIEIAVPRRRVLEEASAPRDTADVGTTI